ncbi:MAG TPA: M56 family metallopeptidase [Pirellulales bacterium]|nr:M56 family metallopeptidase [Pirellulales bacterium]
MSRLANLFDDCVLPLFLLTTLLLAIGCALMGLMGSPAHRQRTGELTMAAIFGWWLLACVPLPRLLPEDLWTQPYSRVAAPVGKAKSDPEHNPSVLPMSESEFASFEVANADEALLDRRQPPLANDELITSSPLDDVRKIQPKVDNTSGDPGRDTDRPSSILRTASPATSSIATAYLSGAAVCLLWLACGHVRLARIRSRARRPPKWLAEMFAGLADEAGVRPALLVSRVGSRPMTWGTWRPTIVLPLALARRRHREQLRMVLLHELAHVVRGDGWGNVLVCLALPLLYPHPLFLWLRAQMRMAAELLADDWAAQRGGKLAYVEQLVSLARSSARSPTLMPVAGAVTLYSSSSQFYRRMQMLISRTCPLSVDPTPRWRFSSLAVTACMAVAVASLAGLRPASGQQPPAGDQAAPQPKDPTEVGRSAAAPDVAEPAKTAQPNQPLTELPIVGRLFTVANSAATESPADAAEQALRARLAAAEERIRLLEAQLKKAEVHLAGATSATAKTAPQAPNTITLTRVAEDGSISHELWTTGEDGRPDKLLQKKSARSPDESPIASVKTTASSDGRVVKEFKAKDGTVTVYVYDGDTGRLMATKRGAWASFGEDMSSAPKAANHAVAIAEGSTDKPHRQPLGDHVSPSGGAVGSETAGLDLVNLATAYADAVSAVEEAEAQLAAGVGGPESNLVPARAALRSARRKQQLLRNLASVAADAARADLERSQQLVRAGATSAEAAAAAESRWKMLNAILQSGSTGNVDATQPGPASVSP